MNKPTPYAPARGEGDLVLLIGHYVGMRKIIFSIKIPFEFQIPFVISGLQLIIIMKIKIPVVPTLILISTASVGFANEAFLKLDTDKDGVVSQTEFFAATDKDFVARDADKNGTVTLEEFMASAVKGFAALDADKNGSLTVEEFTSKTKPEGMDAAKANFAKQDLNKDGVISQDESPAVISATTDFNKRDANKDGSLTKEEFFSIVAADFKMRDRDGKGTLCASDFITKSQEVLDRNKPAFDKLDADKSGMLSKDEVLANDEKIFAGLDADKNASVSKEDYLANAVKSFKSLDKDNNNEVTIEEYTATTKPENMAAAKDAFAKADGNKDGKLSQDEFPAVVSSLAAFTKLDANSDGSLSKEEFLADKTKNFDNQDVNDDSKLDLHEFAR